MLRHAAGAARGGFEHVQNPRFVVSPAKEKLQTIVTAIGSVLIGKEAQVQVALACLLARGLPDGRFRLAQLGDALGVHWLQRRPCATVPEEER